MSESDNFQLEANELEKRRNREYAARLALLEEKRDEKSAKFEEKTERKFAELGARKRFYKEFYNQKIELLEYIQETASTYPERVLNRCKKEFPELYASLPQTNTSIQQHISDFVQLLVAYNP